MTWLTRILAFLNILAAGALVYLAAIAIDARLAWTKAMEDLDKKYRDGQATAQLINELGEKNRDDATRIREHKVSRGLDATIVGVVELLKDPAKRPALLDHLKTDHPQMADSLKSLFDGNDPDATEKARKIMREALADLPGEAQQRYEAGAVLFDYAFDQTVVDGFAVMLGNADDDARERILLAVRLDVLPAFADTLQRAVQGKDAADIPAAAKPVLAKHLADLRANDDRRRQSVNMLFMILAANAPRDEYLESMRKLPAALEPLQAKLGPTLYAQLLQDFNRYLGPRLADEQVRLRNRNLTLGRMIAEVKEQIAHNDAEVKRFNVLRTRQEQLKERIEKFQIPYRYKELAELNALVEEAAAGRLVALYRLQDLKDLLQLRSGQYDALMKENLALEEFIQKTEETLRPSKPAN